MRNKYKVGLITAVMLLSTGCSCSSDNKQEDHKHVYSDEWSFYSGGHFRKCTYKGCTATSKVENHTFDEDDICTVCGYTAGLTKEYDACNHKWSMWEEIESPTCTEMGVKEKYCSKCGKVESATIDIDTEDGHFWVNSETNKPATCTEDGYIGGAYCFYCHRTKEEEIIPKTGHLLSGIYEVKPGIRKYTCSYCNYYEYVLDIRAAEGYDDPNNYMSGIPGRDENAMSKWKVSNVIDNGTYNIQVSAAGNVYGKRKWYNMSIPGLCVNNEAEKPTDDWDGDYLYYLFTNNSFIYPNVKKDWEELGYNNKDIFAYGDFILNVSFSDVTEITLLHAATNISLKIDGIKLCKVIN